MRTTSGAEGSRRPSTPLRRADRGGQDDRGSRDDRGGQDDGGSREGRHGRGSRNSRDGRDGRDNRARAWELLTEKLPGSRQIPRFASGSPGRLMDVARAYDRICKRAEGILQPDAGEDEILATLLIIRMLREKLDHDELKLTTLARMKRITWARIAEWQELSGRQAAERRHLQLNRAHTRPDGTVPRTQSERVEYVRERRSRRAERHWALTHAARIRRVAAQLAAVEDLQQRVDRSAEARLLHALRRSDTGERPIPEPLRWPEVLRACVAEDETFRGAPPAPVEEDSLDGPDWHRRQQETDIVHRLLGLIGYAASRRNIDLSDLPDLADAIRDLHADAQQATRTRR
ncbi:hypothetical protein [Streptomyces sp. URMC 123]|uniref:hypothetical protein n=1 Tax=Streptomyces sp. URMC 123 TaxID=3423403 RepID=UPI003F1D159E